MTSLKFDFKTLLLGFVSLFSTLTASHCQAELSEQNWPLIKEAFFQQRPILVSDLMQVSAPLGAENAAQVPMTLKVKNQPQDAIKKLYILIDANPIPLAAIYHFPEYFKQLELSTRVRLESDSMIRVIAETVKGQLLMAYTPVNAGGGCAGLVAEDDAMVRKNAGIIKFQINSPYKLHVAASATLQVKHPMYTGLQTDAVTKQIKPAFYAKEVDVEFDQTKVMHIEFGVGTAENPHVNFNFDLPDNLLIKVVEKVDVYLQDNEGKVFIKQFLF